MNTTFKALAIGDTFSFASPHLTTYRCVKTSARGYITDTGLACTVGSVNVEVKGVASLSATDPTREEYQGWSTRETWRVRLYLSNDQAMMSAAQELSAKRSTDGRMSAVNRLSDFVEARLSSWQGGQLDGGWRSMFSELATDALARVNWLEVVQSFQPEG